jgi:uncharacterized protein YndB with AHSA1/START domain
MAIFKTIAIVLAVMIASVLIYAATKPDDFRVERSIVINAPSDRIFPLINDLPKHQLWSPFEKTDPAMQRNYSDNASGQGATYAWNGNGQAGKGRMEIIESHPASLVRIQLDFIKPLETTNTVAFTLTPAEGGTTVNWSMHGPMSYVSKLMTTFFDMDKMLGGQFDEGLKNLKGMAEMQASKK